MPSVDFDLGAAETYVDPSQQCDLVMKGGISSGIVYPRAVCHLAATNRLRRVGGTSAGAMAAAAATAAEFGRESGGFVKLNRLPDQLGSDLGDLFQPTPETRTAFSALTALLEPERNRIAKSLSAGLHVVRGAPLAFVAVGVLVLLPLLFALFTVDGGDLGPLTWAALAAVVVIGILTSLVLAVSAALLVVGRRTMAALPGSGFGMCDGHTKTPGARIPPLTDWLSDQIQDLAGLDPKGPPLTVGQLWGEDGCAKQAELRERARLGQRVLPEEWEGAIAARVIDLEVVTTNVTHGRPYRLPFLERIFYFCEPRLREYFPDPIVDYMVENSEEASDKVDGTGPDAAVISMRCPCHHIPVRSFPEPQHLPVVVAARMSLSFPILLSAVPLFCVDYGRPRGKRRLEEAWFSDGGISSNFPMHLFDSALPSRPTFGFNLSPSDPDYPGLVWRPQKEGGSGRLPRSVHVRSVPEFLRAVLNAMQNWNDNTRITMPGYRDRVVDIRQRKGEGGMNLEMPEKVITDLADRGATAAALFDDFDRDLHYWVRYRTATVATDELLTRMHLRYETGFEKFLIEYSAKAPSFKAGAHDLDATREVMKAAKYLADEGHPYGMGIVPKSPPELRTDPRT
jgi:predicted acylesterase/phospholipase RssA